MFNWLGILIGALSSGRERSAGVDEFGNVRGGVRSPYVDVPISTWSRN